MIARLEMIKGEYLPTIEKVVTQLMINQYAEASGDFNPIHVNEEYAKKSRFGSTIAHGMMIAASISELMTMIFKQAWLNGGRLKIRFRAPVFPGDTITTVGQILNINLLNDKKVINCSVEVRRQTNEVAISGEVTVMLNEKEE